MLKPKQRIALVRKIANEISHQSYTEIDLVLSALNVDTLSSWHSTEYEYTLNRLSCATDDALIAYDEPENLETQQELLTPYFNSLHPELWKPGKLKVFISHLSAHKQEVTELKKKLAWYGLDCFVAHEDIRPTKRWEIEIENALKSADILLAFLHPKFHSSEWTDQEIGFAMGRKIPIFVVQKGTTPYGFIGKFQAFSGHDKSSDDLAKEISVTIHNTPDIQNKMSDILLERFAQSKSFSDAIDNANELEKINNWSDRYTEKALKAYKENDQIYNSGKAPYILRSVLKNNTGKTLNFETNQLE